MVTPDKKASQKIGLRLRNLLKLPKAHKWCIYEWFYSNIDRPLFEGDNEFCLCLKESFPNLKTRKLTRVEWGTIRRLMGKPRRYAVLLVFIKRNFTSLFKWRSCHGFLPFRCSSAFFVEERTALRQKRQKMRLLQQGKISDMSNCKDLPDEIPLRLNIGTKVTGSEGAHIHTLNNLTGYDWNTNNMSLFVYFFKARLRGAHDGLFTGQIDAVDTTAATYRVTFDRNGLGTHTVPDYEVLVI